MCWVKFCYKTLNIKRGTATQGGRLRIAGSLSPGLITNGGIHDHADHHDHPIMDSSHAGTDVLGKSHTQELIKRLEQKDGENAKQNNFKTFHHRAPVIKEFRIQILVQLYYTV